MGLTQHWLARSALVIALVLAACGDSEREAPPDAPPGPTSRPDHPEGEAAQVCRGPTRRVKVNGGELQGGDLRLIYHSNSSSPPCEVAVEEDQIELRAADPPVQVQDLRAWCAEVTVSRETANEIEHFVDQLRPTRFDGEGCLRVMLQH